jgi:hypothetical protein
MSNELKMYYFFRKDERGNLTYGEEYIVMSESLETAKESVSNSPEWKSRDYADWNKMGVKVFAENQVLQTEIS